MSFLKSLVSRHIQAASAMRPTGQESCAIFFYGAAPDRDRIAALALGAETSSTVADGKTRITVAWPDVSIVITIDPSWDRTAQMRGMRGWAERFPAHVRALAEVQALVASFDSVQACYGTVCKPGLDADNKVVGLLKALVGDGGGFFFSRNSFYGVDGLRITGFDEDPAWLGTPPKD